MKHQAWLWLPLAVALAGTTHAQDIHKCVGEDGAVTYQNAPCTGAQVDAGVLRLPGYADPPQRDGAMAPPVDAAPASARPVEDPYAPEPAAPDGRDAFPFRTSIAVAPQVIAVASMGPLGTATRSQM